MTCIPTESRDRGLGNERHLLSTLESRMVRVDNVGCVSSGNMHSLSLNFK